MKTLGDHIRKRRLELGLLQREVAEKIGVTSLTITNWEGNATTPMCQHIKRILEFLAYNPFPPAKTFSEHLVQYRKIQGLSQRQFAKRLQVDQSTLAGWEQGHRKPTGKFLEKVERFLGFNARLTPQ